MKSKFCFVIAATILVASCSQVEDSSKNDAKKAAEVLTSSTASNSPAQTDLLPMAAMNSLNECVANEVTVLVNEAEGNVDDQLKSSIAIRAVEACDRLIDAASEEHVSNLETIATMPEADPASVKIVEDTKKALQSRSSADWRKFHTDVKIGFAKNYVAIVAARLNPSNIQDKSGYAIAPNQ